MDGTGEIEGSTRGPRGPNNSTELGAIITVDAVLSRNTNTSQDSNFCQFQYEFFHNLYLEGTNSHNNCEFHTLVFNHQYTHTETMLDV